MKIDNDPRFGEIAILYSKNDSTDRIMRKVKKCSTEDEYENS